jgi:hypothetical protein
VVHKLSSDSEPLTLPGKQDVTSSVYLDGLTSIPTITPGHRRVNDLDRLHIIQSSHRTVPDRRPRTEARASGQWDLSICLAAEFQRMVQVEAGSKGANIQILAFPGAKKEPDRSVTYENDLPLFSRIG